MFVAKNENTPTIDSKTVDSADPNVSFDGKTVKIGQQLTYTVKAIVPKTAAGYDSYPYYIQDVASKGLTIHKDSIKVMAGNKVANDYEITSTVDQNTGETTTTITIANAKVTRASSWSSPTTRPSTTDPRQYQQGHQHSQGLP